MSKREILLGHTKVISKFGLGEIEIPENCSLNLVILQKEPEYVDGLRSGRLSCNF